MYNMHTQLSSQARLQPLRYRPVSISNLCVWGAIVDTYEKEGIDNINLANIQNTRISQNLFI